MSAALVVAVLLIANAIFVAAEFALVGAPRATIDHLASRGSRAASRVREILDDPRLQDRFLATTQIGISLASLGLGMYGEPVLAHVIEARLHGWPLGGWLAPHALASGVALTALTYLHIVIGEIIPKALALQRPDRMIMWVVPVMSAIGTGLAPLVRVLSGGGAVVLRLAGVRRDAESADRYHSTEELQFIIEESERGGLLKGESSQVLRELFSFGDVLVSEVMLPFRAVVGIPVGARPADLREILRTHPYRRYPVFDGHPTSVAGSVHIKTILGHLQAGRTLQRADARPMPSITDTATLDAVLGAMRTHGTQVALVTGAGGAPVGMVAMENLCARILGTIDEAR